MPKAKGLPSFHMYESFAGTGEDAAFPAELLVFGTVEELLAHLDEIWGGFPVVMTTAGDRRTFAESLATDEHHHLWTVRAGEVVGHHDFAAMLLVRVNGEAPIPMARREALRDRLARRTARIEISLDERALRAALPPLAPPSPSRARVPLRWSVPRVDTAIGTSVACGHHTLADGDETF